MDLRGNGLKRASRKILILVKESSGDFGGRQRPSSETVVISSSQLQPLRWRCQDVVKPSVGVRDDVILACPLPLKSTNQQRQIQMFQSSRHLTYAIAQMAKKAGIRENPSRWDRE